MRPIIDRETLVAGMTLVPGLLSRNRSFALFQDPEVRRARARSALLRGIVKQLAGASGKVEKLEVVAAKDLRELRYHVPGVRMVRRAVLTEVEYACVAYLAGRASVPGLAASDDDRERIHAALRRLSTGLGIAPLDPR